MHQQSNFTKVWFYLLINTKSGGGWGRCYLQLKKQAFAFQYKKRQIIQVTLVDLFDSAKKQQIFQTIRKLQRNPQNDLRIIICGGDGTIIWGIEECINARLNLEKITFASLPIGTGNDFTRTIGWGGDPLKFHEGNLVPLKKRIVEWINSTISTYDVWEVNITTHDEGQIYKVKDKQDFPLGIKNYQKGFVNYVGIGIDARVSYYFQKNRMSTKLMNLAVYGCFGFLFCCKSIPELSESIQSFYQENVTQQYESPVQMLKQDNLDSSMYQQFTKHSESPSPSNITLKQGYHGLICLNSLSYMAGITNVWNTGTIGCKQKSHIFKQQEINDRKIQFVGFKNQLALGLERFVHSGAKVAQGEGPFVIQFTDEEKNNENYLQIDGEGLKIRGIKQIVIKRYSDIQTSQIKVMVKNP